jgi:hypothetical protein
VQDAVKLSSFKSLSWRGSRRIWHPLVDFAIDHETLWPKRVPRNDNRDRNYRDAYLHPLFHFHISFRNAGVRPSPRSWNTKAARFIQGEPFRRKSFCRLTFEIDEFSDLEIDLTNQ